ncbi:MAG TPA: bifunctional diaminohydroxyphosphoribosylaminopyrimidine deaminase/5-amino-6-(5-phosphoribosylamino)uracil reductase RibD [Bacteroidales bacterium]|nr:bifunctional diaminohydroxyphosphoribosylaminopyrimidine deaminase/5-amino-6-(5-phosphoribosylamino)uracil reductase RibD [Bacteroidales bacterium]
MPGNDIKYMKRAIALASLAAGNTSPNPLVGAVIVQNNTIIGEGYHTKAGEAHAEIVAINSVKDKDLLKSATMFVNLEPCSHYGRTPPCAKRIIDEGIPRVVVAVADPSEKVHERGIRMLKDAGIEVITGILETESRDLNKRFFSFHEKGRPYIILKWARSKDGYIDRVRANNEIGPNWITGLEERMLVHKWRSEEDAILVGDKTVCNDDPSLNVRLWSGNDPRKFVLSESADLEPGMKIFQGDKPTVIFNLQARQNNIQADYICLSSRDKALEEVMAFMKEAEIQSLIVEGGYTVLSQFIDAGLWDEARVFTGDILFNEGLKSPVIEGKVTGTRTFERSYLEYLKPGE